MPVRRADDEPLQQLALEMRSEMDTKAGRLPQATVAELGTHAWSAGPEVPEAAPGREEGAHPAQRPGPRLRFCRALAFSLARHLRRWRNARSRSPTRWCPTSCLP